MPIYVIPKNNGDQTIDTVNVINHWADNPVAFVKEALGVGKIPNFKITEQQKEALSTVSRMIRAKVKASTGQKLNKFEAKLAGKRGISIMGAQGVGKDSFCAWFILYFLFCYPRSLIPCTAPVADQLRNGLWREVVKWLNMKDENGNYICAIRDFIGVTVDKIYHVEGKKKEWFAFGRTCSTNSSEDEQAETLAGNHEDYMCFLVDEASKVPNPVFNPIIGSLTGKCNFSIVIFNPTRRSGFAFDTHFGRGSDQWVNLHWSAEESDLVTKEHIQQAKEKYGEDSDFYRIRIQGIPPVASTDSVIPWEWVYDAIERDVTPSTEDPVIFGVDCAGMGKDKSVIAIRRGPVVERIVTFSGLKTNELAGWVLSHAREYEPEAICIDPIGLGAGVFNDVRLYYTKTFACNVAAASRDKRFYRYRDELWFRGREKFEKGLISIPNDEELIAELSMLKYKPNDRGLIKVESKAELHARGKDSPDKADAVIMTFHLLDSMFHNRPTFDGRDPMEDNMEFSRPMRHSWMAR